MVEQTIILRQNKSRLSVAALWSGFLTHKWFILAVVALLGLGAWQSARVLLGPAIVVDQVKRGRLVETVVASGHVETPYRVEIGSQITATVQEVLVRQGEKVSKGQPLILLESRELKAAVVQAEGALVESIFSRADAWIDWRKGARPDRPLRAFAEITARALGGALRLVRKPTAGGAA